MSTEADGFNDDSIQRLLNDTDSELSDLSHLDAPNDGLYMIGGVCVAMFTVGVIIVLLAVTIRKRFVQNPADRPGFVRGFRKNLGGRWRRLVKRKPTQEVYTIPAELKPQLKQIYVY